METLAQRVQFARERIDISRSDLARKIGVTPQAIHNLEKGITKTLKANTLLNLSQAFGVRAAWLESGQEPMLSQSNTDELPTNLRRVPLISWVQAGNWTQLSDPYLPGQAEHFEETTRAVSKNSYALEVRGDSMEPRFPEGCIIIVDPDRAALPGSFVVVRLEDVQEVTFKQLVQDAGVQYLRPLNDRYPMLQINGKATICGVVVEKVTRERF